MCSSFPRLESCGLEVWVSIQHNADMQNRQTAHPRFWGLCRKTSACNLFNLESVIQYLRCGTWDPIPSPLPCVDEAFPPTFEMTPEGDNCSLGSHRPACTVLCQETGHQPLSTLLSWGLLCDDLPFLSVGLKDLAHFSSCFKLTVDLISWPSSIPGNGHGRGWKLPPTRTRLGWPPCLCDLGQETSFISETWWWYPSVAPQLLWG